MTPCSSTLLLVAIAFTSSVFVSLVSSSDPYKYDPLEGMVAVAGANPDQEMEGAIMYVNGVFGHKSNLYFLKKI